MTCPPRACIVMVQFPAFFSQFFHLCIMHIFRMRFAFLPFFPFCFPSSSASCAACSHFAQSALKFIMLHNHLSSFPFHFPFPFGARSERIKIFRNIFHAFSRMATGNGIRSIAPGVGRICQLGERESDRLGEHKREREAGREHPRQSIGHKFPEYC